MSDIASSKPVLVTGGSGFIASWIIKLLLEKGAQVRTTVRNKSKKEKYAHLLAIEEQSSGTLEIFEADLLNEGAFDAAVAGCGLVLHTASPFMVRGIKDAENQLVRPALQGTRNVLNAVEKSPSVSRVVLTSSVASIYGDSSEINALPGKRFTEAHWNETSSLKHNPYSYSKVIAEKEAWKMAKAQNRWQLTVINPAFVLGPSLTQASNSPSLSLIKQLMDGSYKSGVPELHFGIVDVRNVAQAHVEAAYREKVEGRHILAHEKSLSMVDLASILREEYKDRFKIPKGGVPKLLLYLLGPFMGFSWKYIRNNVGIPLLLDNSKSKEALGIKYIPPKETLIAQAEEMIRLGVI
ncbi:MAG TPA: aldehyde reductase [Bacteroidetes bacterium]|nr:aldehyde reductase [Bacteroidota bacterium]